ncbi:MAG TPA: hypothetical protein VK061_03155 [Bacillota bacterium]|nr:hypothetical protein [Bacillota bacterium]
MSEEKQHELQKAHERKLNNKATPPEEFPEGSFGAPPRSKQHEKALEDISYYEKEYDEENMSNENND